jgi:tripartite-type tricarboxylate transporter receptor subunit TctC
MNPRYCMALGALSIAQIAIAAEPYPNRPIRMIVPYAVGGATDITARIIGPRMSESLGQQIVVDNRAGGASITGTDMVAKAAPDGYTIMIATIAFGAYPSLFTKLPYDSQRDFAPVSLIALVPIVLAVHPSIAPRSVKELVALARAKPGTLNFASAGNGSATHLAGELFKALTGTNIVHVPYKGGGPAVVAAVSGEVAVCFATVSSVIAHFKGNRLIPIGVSTAKRLSSLPDVPTVAEAGVPAYEMFEWQGLVVPAGTPKPIIDRLNQETLKALANPEVRERIAALGADVVGSTPAVLAAHIKTEIAKWAKVTKDAGIKPD